MIQNNNQILKLVGKGDGCGNKGVVTQESCDGTVDYLDCGGKWHKTKHVKLQSYTNTYIYTRVCV